MNRLDEISDEISQRGSAFADYVMGDPAVWWRQLITTQHQLEAAAELATAYRWYYSTPEAPEQEDWEILVASAGAPDVCDLSIAAQTCREHISSRLQEDCMLAKVDCLLAMIEHCTVLAVV